MHPFLFIKIQIGKAEMYLSVHKFLEVIFRKI